LAAVVLVILVGIPPTTISSAAAANTYDNYTSSRSDAVLTPGEEGSRTGPPAHAEPTTVRNTRGPDTDSRFLVGTRIATNSAPSPRTDIPADAQIRVLKPDPNGGAQCGVEHKWVNADGQTVRFRVHGPDGNAPPGTNAATGETYRVQVGGRYMDADGNLHPRGVHNPRSPNYDPDAANATHIPWQGLSWPN